MQPSRSIEGLLAIMAALRTPDGQPLDLTLTTNGSLLKRKARALKAADLIVFVVDGREGLIPGDEDIAQSVRDANVPVILAINKSDDRRARAGALELYRLGFEPVVEISAEHGEDSVNEAIDDVIGNYLNKKMNGIRIDWKSVTEEVEDLLENYY